eukprot:m.520324 g.520324  ORF g.520324 m.520324 type:complete len:59 (-) comp139610_c0_seq1:24-200(-)
MQGVVITHSVKETPGRVFSSVDVSKRFFVLVSMPLSVPMTTLAVVVVYTLHLMTGVAP